MRVAPLAVTNAALTFCAVLTSIRNRVLVARPRFAFYRPGMAGAERVRLCCADRARLRADWLAMLVIVQLVGFVERFCGSLASNRVILADRAPVLAWPERLLPAVAPALSIKQTGLRAR